MPRIPLKCPLAPAAPELPHHDVTWAKRFTAPQHLREAEAPMRQCLLTESRCTNTSQYLDAGAPRSAARHASLPNSKHSEEHSMITPFLQRCVPPGVQSRMQ
mmetsp:Transcript_82370/g.143146  ORF Transcript_82370/g.143146 Transcript_82370/m.143146 type:complete len:102 (-) Transcript_82370:2753-3058(-)